MDREKWQNRILESCKEAGTYEPAFDDVIETLAGILETRDEAEKQFKKMNSQPVVQHTNKNGHVNLVKNPALVVINEMNSQALMFWKELGLTAKAYQAMQKSGFQKKETTVEDLLSGIGI